MKINTKRKSLLLIMLFSFLSLFLFACDKNKQKDELKIFNEINESIVIPNETTADLTLPTETSLNTEATLHWVSKNFKVIAQDGTVYRPDVDTLVELDLFITIGTKTQVYKREVLVKGWGPIVLDKEVFKNPAGYASLGVTNRYDVLPEDENYYEVNDEIEFLDAYIDSQNKKNVVIEITNDLNLGARYIGKLLIERGLWDGVDPKKTPYLDGKNFRENTNLPENHPILIENGVGQLLVDSRDGLMIFSKTGNTINHLTVHIKGTPSNKSNNIVFRNLKMAGIWEWDEIDRGDYKALDWDHFTIEFADNIWLDHLTFKTSYDGIVDVKGGTSNITLSWLDLDFTVDEFIMAQFHHLEANKNRYPFYRELRDTISMEDIATVAAGQKKGFNFGNTEGGPNFETITITMHHIYAKNLQDRFPRLRRGDVHLYNVVLDSETLQRLRHIDMKVISQAMVPTEQGAVLMENSRIVGVREPIKTHQANNLDPDFTGKFKVLNSEYRNHDFYYFGGSEDKNYDNPWKRYNQNINYDLEFYFRSYENVPYQYQLQDANKLTRLFMDNLVGAGNIEGFNWLEITGQIDKRNIDYGIRIDQNSIKGLNTHIARLGEPVVNFTPEVYNYYTNSLLRVDREYTYYVDSSNVDVNTPGVYEIEYTFMTLHDEREIKYSQTYVVYNPEQENEIYQGNIGQAFDNKISGSVDVYEADGELYYYLSNNETETQDLVVANGVSKAITNTTIEFNDVDVTNDKYIHFVVVNKGLKSKVFTHEIKKETVIEISTVAQFNAMLIDYYTKGNYYKLTNDLDFEGYTLHYLNADHIFQGVLDGQGFALRNIIRHAYAGGIFHTLKDAKVKNIIFDNVNIDISATPTYDDETGEISGWNRPSDRSGIVAGRINGGFGIVENVTITNSKLSTEKNYGSLVIGRIEAGSYGVFQNITITNSRIDSTGSYIGGIVGGLENNAEALVEDIYFNTVELKEGLGLSSRMVGTIVGRANSTLTVRRVIAMNVIHTTNGQIGGVIGKDDRKGQDKLIILEHIFIDLTPTITLDADGNPNRYRGTLVGNPDIGQYPNVINRTNVWSTPFETGSSGLSTENVLEKIELTNVWWQTQFSELLATGLWEVRDNLLVLKK